MSVCGALRYTGIPSRIYSSLIPSVPRTDSRYSTYELDSQLVYSNKKGAPEAIHHPSIMCGNKCELEFM